VALAGWRMTELGGALNQGGGVVRVPR
jgi:hypothetical protein